MSYLEELRKKRKRGYQGGVQKPQQKDFSWVKPPGLEEEDLPEQSTQNDFSWVKPPDPVVEDKTPDSTMTLSKMMNKYSPPHENDTDSIIANLTNTLGVNADDNLSDIVTEDLAEAIAQGEGWYAESDTLNLGQRNNNPGNLEYRPWMKKYGGELSDDGRFAKFPEEGQGWNALNRLIDNYKEFGEKDAKKEEQTESMLNQTLEVSDLEREAKESLFDPERMMKDAPSIGPTPPEQQKIYEEELPVLASKDWYKQFEDSAEWYEKNVHDVKTAEEEKERVEWMKEQMKKGIYAHPDGEMGYFEEFVNTQVLGASDMIDIAGGVAGWAGFEGVQESLRDEAAFTQYYLTRGKHLEGGADFKWSDAADPRWWLTKPARSIPLMIPLLTSGAAAYTVGGSIGTTLGLGGFGVTASSAIIGATTSRSLESLMEAGGVYNEMIDDGHSEEEASKAAASTWGHQMKGVMYDIPQAIAMFAKVDKIVPKGMQGSFLKYLKTVAGGLFNVTSEGLEEVHQNYWNELGKATVTGAVDPGLMKVMNFTEWTPEQKETFLIGAGMGLGGSAFGALGGNAKETGNSEEYNNWLNKRIEQVISKSIGLQTGQTIRIVNSDGIVGLHPTKTEHPISGLMVDNPIPEGWEEAGEWVPTGPGMGAGTGGAFMGDGTNNPMAPKGFLEAYREEDDEGTLITYIDDQHRVVQMRHSPGSESVPPRPGQVAMPKNKGKKVQVAQQSLEDINSDMRLKDPKKIITQDLSNLGEQAQQVKRVKQELIKRINQATNNWDEYSTTEDVGGIFPENMIDHYFPKGSSEAFRQKHGKNIRSQQQELEYLQQQYDEIDAIHTEIRSQLKQLRTKLKDFKAPKQNDTAVQEIQQEAEELGATPYEKPSIDPTQNYPKLKGNERIGINEKGEPFIYRIEVKENGDVTYNPVNEDGGPAPVQDLTIDSKGNIVPVKNPVAAQEEEEEKPTVQEKQSAGTMVGQSKFPDSRDQKDTPESDFNKPLTNETNTEQKILDQAVSGTSERKGEDANVTTDDVKTAIGGDRLKKIVEKKKEAIAYIKNKTGKDISDIVIQGEDFLIDGKPVTGDVKRAVKWLRSMDSLTARIGNKQRDARKEYKYKIPPQFHVDNTNKEIDNLLEGGVNDSRDFHSSATEYDSFDDFLADKIEMKMGHAYQFKGGNLKKPATEQKSVMDAVNEVATSEGIDPNNKNFKKIVKEVDKKLKSKGKDKVHESSRSPRKVDRPSQKIQTYKTPEGETIKETEDVEEETVSATEESGSGSESVESDGERRSRIGERPGLVVVGEEHIPTPKENVSPGTYEIGEDQRLGINLILDRQNDGHPGFGLFDGTGVGKTRQMLVSAYEIAKKTGKPSIIITQNKNIIEQGFVPEAEALGIAEALKDGTIEIGTYDGLRAGKVGQQSEYSSIMYDEAHNLKNFDAGKSAAARELDDKSPFKVYATATPMDKITSAVYFFHNIMGIPRVEVLDRIGVALVDDPNVKGGKRAEFKKGFSWLQVIDEIVKMREDAIKQGAMIRREFPFYGTINASIPIKMTPEQKQQQNEISSSWGSQRRFAGSELSIWSENQKIQIAIDKAKKDIAEGFNVILVVESVDTKLIFQDPTTGEIVTKTQIERNYPQFDLEYQTDAQGQNIIVKGRKVKHTKETLKNTYPSIIARSHPGTAQTLSAALNKEGINHSKIYGSGTSRKIKEVEKFQSNENQVAVMTAASGGTGINLDDQTGERPRRMYILTVNYSGDVVEQVTGRVSRRKTQTPAYIEMIMLDGSINDNRRMEIINKKIGTLRAVQHGADIDVEKLKREDEDVASLKRLEGVIGGETDFVEPPSMEEIRAAQEPEDVKEKVEISPKKVEISPEVHGGTIPHETVQEMADTYSGDKIPEGKIKKPYEYNGKLLIATGVIGTGARGTEVVNMYELVPKENYKGEIREKSEGEYGGVLVKHRGKEYVILDPMITFASDKFKTLEQKNEALEEAEQQADEDAKTDGDAIVSEENEIDSAEDIEGKIFISLVKSGIDTDLVSDELMESAVEIGMDPEYAEDAIDFAVDHIVTELSEQENDSDQPTDDVVEVTESTEIDRGVDTIHKVFETTMAVGHDGLDAEGVPVGSGILGVNLNLGVFQDRSDPFNRQVYEKIITDGWSELDEQAIQIWVDRNGEIGEANLKYIISGHTRAKAAAKLGMKNVKVKILKEGDLNVALEAMERANKDSNLTYTDRIRKAGRIIASMEGKPRQEVIDQVELILGDNAREYILLSYLDPNGKFMEILKTKGEAKDNALPMAKFMGGLRRDFADKVTDKHEDQVFEFMKGHDLNANQRAMLKDSINKQVTDMFNKDSRFILKGEELITGDDAREDLSYVNRKLQEAKEQLRAVREIEGPEAVELELKLVKKIQQLEKDKADIKDVQIDMFKNLDVTGIPGSFMNKRIWKMFYYQFLATGEFTFKTLPKYVQKQGAKLGINRDNFNSKFRAVADMPGKMSQALKNFWNRVKHFLSKSAKRSIKQSPNIKINRYEVNRRKAMAKMGILRRKLVQDGTHTKESLKSALKRITGQESMADVEDMGLVNQYINWMINESHGEVNTSQGLSIKELKKIKKERDKRYDNYRLEKTFRESYREFMGDGFTTDLTTSIERVFERMVPKRKKQLQGDLKRAKTQEKRDHIQSLLDKFDKDPAAEFLALKRNQEVEHRSEAFPQEQELERLWSRVPRREKKLMKHIIESGMVGEEEIYVDDFGIERTRLKRVPVHPNLSNAGKQFMQWWDVTREAIHSRAVQSGVTKPEMYIQDYFPLVLKEDVKGLNRGHKDAWNNTVNHILKTLQDRGWTEIDKGKSLTFLVDDVEINYVDLQYKHAEMFLDEFLDRYNKRGVRQHFMDAVFNQGKRDYIHSYPLEMHRDRILPEEMYEDAVPDVLSKYINSAWETITMKENFSEQLELDEQSGEFEYEVSNRIRQDLIDMGFDHRRVTTLLQAGMRLTIAEAHYKTFLKFAKNMSILKLGVKTAIKNMSDIAKATSYASNRSVLNTMLRMMIFPSERTMGRELIGSKQVFKQELEKAGITGGWARLYTKWIGFTTSERFVRKVQGLSAVHYAERQLNLYMSSPFKWRQNFAKRKFVDWGLNIEEIAKRGKMTRKQKLRLGNLAVMASQPTSPLDKPMLWDSSTAVATVVIYKTFGHKQLRFLKDYTIKKELIQHKNPMPALRFLFTGHMMGMPIQMLMAYLFGNDDEERENEDAIVRYAKGVIDSGQLGVIGDMTNLVRFGNVVYSGMNFVLGPFVSMVIQDVAGGLVLGDIKAKKKTMKRYTTDKIPYFGKDLGDAVYGRTDKRKTNYGG